MKVAAGVASLLVVGAAGAAGFDAHEDKFEEFLATHHKSYSSEVERAAKYAVFVENLEHIASHNMAEQGDAVHSHLSPFADITPAEFARRNGLLSVGQETKGRVAAPNLDVGDLPVSFDWREKGAVNFIKDQATCGSCWAFATVANIEGAAFVSTGRLVSLSEQELVDCDRGGEDMGCEGGLPQNAYKYLIEHHTGLEIEDDYPYRARNGKCKDKKKKEVAFVTTWTGISTDEDQIAASLMQYGPLAIGINAVFMQFYFGGIATYPKVLCNPSALDHGVAIVGFGFGGLIKKKNYWIIRNSWGPSWGEKGYYRIVRGYGMCGLNTMVTTVSNVSLTVFEEKDVSIVV